MSKMTAWLRKAFTPPKPLTKEEERQALLEAGGKECDGCGNVRLPHMLSTMSDTQLVDGEAVHRRLLYCVDHPGCGKVVAAKLDDARRKAGEGGR